MGQLFTELNSIRYR